MVDLLALLPGLLLALEFQPRPFPPNRVADVLAAYTAAATLPGPALYSVPVGLLDGYRQVGLSNPAELFYQARHHKALPGGYILRVPAATFTAFDPADPVQHALSRAQMPNSAQPASPTLAQTQAFLRRYRPAAFVVHPAFRNAPAHRLLRRLLQPIGFSGQVVSGYVLLWPVPLPVPPSQ